MHLPTKCGTQKKTHSMLTKTHLFTNLHAGSYKLNTFASKRLVFEGKNESFRFENASNLTHDLLYNNLNKKS